MKEQAAKGKEKMLRLEWAYDRILVENGELEDRLRVELIELDNRYESLKGIIQRRDTLALTNQQLLFYCGEMEKKLEEKTRQIVARAKSEIEDVESKTVGQDERKAANKSDGFKDIYNYNEKEEEIFQEKTPM